MTYILLRLFCKPLKQFRVQNLLNHVLARALRLNVFSLVQSVKGMMLLFRNYYKVDLILHEDKGWLIENQFRSEFFTTFEWKLTKFKEDFFQYFFVQMQVTMEVLHLIVYQLFELPDGAVFPAGNGIRTITRDGFDGLHRISLFCHLKKTFRNWYTMSWFRKLMVHIHFRWCFSKGNLVHTILDPTREFWDSPK